MELLKTTNFATKKWYDEVSEPGYNFDKPGLKANPKTGHFTQVVWKGSTKLGCGISGPVVVCRYCEPGNRLGQETVNVFPEKRECKKVATDDDTDNDEEDNSDNDNECKAPMPTIAEIPVSATYNQAYNAMAVQEHNSHRRAHQV